MDLEYVKRRFGALLIFGELWERYGLRNVGGPCMIIRRFLESREGLGTCKKVEDLYLCVNDEGLTSPLPH